MTLRRALILGVGVLVVLFAAVLIGALALQNGAFQGALLRQLSARVHRPVQAGQGLHLRLFSSRPQLVVEGLVVGNPPWMPGGELARVERFVLHFSPSFAHPLRIDTVELHGARLQPRRLDDGRSNWQLRPPRGPGEGARLPAIRGLVARDVRMDLDDQRRHLVFHGSVEQADDTAELRLRIRGELNGRPMQAELQGDALRQVSADRPYSFRFDERSGRSRFRGEGRVLAPFDLSGIDFDFQAEGPDLRQLYTLIGVHLPPTGAYRLRGRLERRGAHFRFQDLQLRSGGSDLAGELTIDATRERRRLKGELRSHRLRLADVGERAAGGEPRRDPAHRIPDTPLPLGLFRDRDVELAIAADEVVAGPLTLPKVSLALKAERGVLDVDPLLVRTAQGRVQGRLHLDLQPRTPVARLRLDFHDAQLGALLHGRYDPPPLEAPLRGRASLESTGADLRSLAAALRGDLALGLGEGHARAALTEALGLDLGAVGLALSKSHESVTVRCGLARLTAADGRLHVEQLVLDTAPTVLRGSGDVDLARETLALEIKGQPKSPRLRVRSTLLVGGSLAHPAPRLERRAAGAQGLAAAALATVVAPVAAAAAFVDPGRGEDVDCEALLRETGRD